MKVLFVSNYWPPNHLGGYELGCSKIVEYICRDGHDVTVLTNKNVAGCEFSDGYKVLANLCDFRLSQNVVTLILCSLANYYSYVSALRSTEYDRVYIFGLNYVGFSILLHSVRPTCRVVAYVSDESYCHLDYMCRFVLKLLKVNILFRLILSLFLPAVSVNALGTINFVCTSDYISRKMLESNLLNPRLTTLHWGVEVDGSLSDYPLGRCKNVILGGRVSPDKGTKFALEVVEEVFRSNDISDIVVNLLADIPDTEYGREVKEIVDRLNRKSTVKLGYMDSVSMRDLFREGGIFLFPSAWEEPFSILLLEAMSSGLLVIASNTGGTGEAIQHGKNGFLVDAGDRELWGDLLTSSIKNMSDLDEIRIEAMGTVQRRFSITEMVKKLLLV